MLFNSCFFIFLFFPLALAGYYGLNHAGKYRAALTFLSIMSLWFCGYGGLYDLIILMVSILLNYGITTAIRLKENRKGKKFWLVAGILLNIGALFLFKYYNFFTGSLNTVLKTDIPLFQLVLPLGISFYTFQQISWLVDSFNGECEKYGFSEYALHITFFPRLTQGPITCQSELLPQFRNPENRKINYENLCRGIYAFAVGLAKKVLIADTFAGIVNIGYDHICDLNSPSAALVMLCYSLQIYFDFSGYCDMAYGVGYMFNIRLPLNFNSPYRAESVSDFWDRWHMTLTRFFTRYLYIPLGGSRRGKARTCLNILLVFLVSGLWHGANWTFILWGLFHGLLKVLERLTNIASLKIPRFIRIFVTFLTVTFAWSLFRASSVGDAVMLWGQLLHGGPGAIDPAITDHFQELTEISLLHRLLPGSVLTDYPWLAPVTFTFAALTGCMAMKNTQEKAENLTLSYRKLFVVVILMLWSILSLSEISEFLYFSF